MKSLVMVVFRRVKWVWIWALITAAYRNRVEVARVVGPMADRVGLKLPGRMPATPAPGSTRTAGDDAGMSTSTAGTPRR